MSVRIEPERWRRVVVAGLNGSVYVIVACVECAALVREEDAAKHIHWHRTRS